ncbi:Hypothetical protein A7982_05155 [Minicystis rosea]|nr:Hypothetical protein A7982_05155 [Minicystis rosea]
MESTSVGERDRAANRDGRIGHRGPESLRGRGLTLTTRIPHITVAT